MLTPAFELSQDANYVFFDIKASFAKISDTEVFIEDDEFKFYSKPYFLRLNLPGKLVEDGRETAKYDNENGHFIIKIPKETPGEVFEGLDMLSKLLAPKGDRSATQPLIEVIGSNSEYAPSEILQDGDIDWYVEQQPYNEATPKTKTYSYGFASQKSEVFTRLQSELNYVVDVNNPDQLSHADRQKQREKQELETFNDDYYLADLFQGEVISDLLYFKPDWVSKSEGTSLQDKDNSLTCSVCFNTDEKERMRNLPRKEYLIDYDILPSVYLGLVDIVFAYCYNRRITEGEHNVESGWNISKLSSTLSWFEESTDLKEVVIINIRRSLCFPLYRNWKLSLQVLQDTQELFSVGKRLILKCLLDIHKLFVDCDSRYILNDLYITDYCVWIQSACDKQIESLAKTLKLLNITKADIGLSLEELEMAANLVMEEDLSSQINKLTVTDSDDESTETSDEDDESICSDDESTCSDDESTCSDDENTCSDDESTCSDDESTSSRDESTYSADEGTCSNNDKKSCSEICKSNTCVSQLVDVTCNSSENRKCEQNFTKNSHSDQIENNCLSK